LRPLRFLSTFSIHPRLNNSFKMTNQKPSPQTQTLTKKIIAHRGFIPVIFLLFLSVLASGLARFSVSTQHEFNANAVKADATVVKTFSSETRRTQKLGGTIIKHYMTLEITLSNGTIIHNNMVISKDKLKTVKIGDKIPVSYDPKNPKFIQQNANGFTLLADRLRLLAWALFAAAIALIGYHFLKHKMAKRQKRWENQK